jgi:putative FmdB family regulatory protein
VPTYQYACSACQHEFEVFQAFSDSSLTHCPECNGKLNKVYSAVGVVFKGSGFYKTDSKSESKPANPVAKEKPSKPANIESAPAPKSTD